MRIGKPLEIPLPAPARTDVLALVGAPRGDLVPAIMANAVSLPTALLVGAGFGVVGALLGEVLQRVLYAHTESHLDRPPRASS